MEERFQAAGLGGWGVSDISGFVVRRVGSPPLEDAVKGKVEERTGCGGFDIRVLLEIPSVVKKAGVSVLEEDLQGDRKAGDFYCGIVCFIPHESPRRSQFPCEARDHGIEASLDFSNPAIGLGFQCEDSFAQERDFVKTR